MWAASEFGRNGKTALVTGSMTCGKAGQLAHLPVVTPSAGSQAWQTHKRPRLWSNRPLLLVLDYYYIVDLSKRELSQLCGREREPCFGRCLIKRPICCTGGGGCFVKWPLRKKVSSVGFGQWWMNLEDIEGWTSLPFWDLMLGFFCLAKFSSVRAKCICFLFPYVFAHLLAFGSGGFDHNLVGTETITLGRNA